MANSELQGKHFEIPTNISEHLLKIYNAYKGAKNVEGYKRLEDRNKRETGMQMDRDYSPQLSNMNNSPSKSHKSGVDKHMNEQALNSLKRINQLMENLWQL